MSNSKNTKQISRTKFYHNATVTWTEGDMWKNEYGHKIFDKAEVECSNVFLAIKGNRVHIFRRIPFAKPKKQQLIQTKLLSGKSFKIVKKTPITKRDFCFALQVTNVDQLGCKFLK